MPRVFIKNANIHPLKGIFKGEDFEIEAEDYWRDKKGNKRTFDIYEANDFKGTYHPAPIQADGKRLDDAKYYKILKIEPVDGEGSLTGEVETVGFRCMVKDCKHTSPSSEELEAHVRVRHPGLETLILPEVEQEIKAKKRKAS